MTKIRAIKAAGLRGSTPEGGWANEIKSDDCIHTLIAVYTDQGITGWGSSFTNDLLVEGALRILEPLLIGENALEPERVTEKLHANTFWMGRGGSVTHAISGINIALWDILGKATGQPVSRLLGGRYRERVLPYASLLMQEPQPLAEHLHAVQAQGFRAFKLKVGSPDGDRDIRRASMLRELAGPDALIMLDANQQWSLSEAIKMCQALRSVSPYFIEEPTHPDDIQAHRTLAEAIAPIPIALGEHVPNRVMFKNFMQAGAVNFVQVDCTRVAGISEFLTVSLMARKFGLPVVPHVGDMGQIHQHLVLFNHIGMGHEALFLECIPHLQQYFTAPARIEHGVYATPEAPGSSSDMKNVAPHAVAVGS